MVICRGVFAVIEFSVLGPLEASRAGQPIPLGGPKQRALLAYLLLRANRPVSPEELGDALWPRHDADAARQALRVAVSRLRTALGGESALATRPAGYELIVARGQLDLERFESLIAAAERAFTDEDWALAATGYSEALRLWRGPALAGIAVDGLDTDIARLEELRLGATERRIEAELSLGRHAALVAELDGLVARHPYREQLLRQHMLALYRSGRQAEALASYRDARRRLVEELGIEPGSDLQELERAILRHDPSLAPVRVVPAGDEVKPERRVWPLMLSTISVGIVIVAALGSTYGLVRRQSPHRGVRAVSARTNSLVALDEQSGRPLENIALGAPPGDITAGADAVWVLLPSTDVVVRVGPKQSTRTPVGVPPDAIGIAAGAGGVWVADRWNTITRIDSLTGAADRPIRLAPERVFPNEVADITATHDAVWLASRDTAEAARYSVDSGRLRNHVGGGGRDEAFFVGAGTSVIGRALGDIWLTNRIDVAGDAATHSGRVTRIDGDSGRVVRRFVFGSTPRALAATRDAMWIAVEDRVWRLGQTDAFPSRDVLVPSGPIALAADDSGAWVATRDRHLLHIDPAGSRVLGRWRFDKAPAAVAVGYGKVWLAVGRRD